MRKAILTVFIMLLALPVLAQNTEPEKPVVDSTYAAGTAIDSTLVGKDIFQLLGSGRQAASREGRIVIDQSQAVAKALSRHISANARKMQTGYRIRIYFDNSQNARTRSEKIAASFKAQHPGINVYRDYENPYFKVTVGDFRSKQDAQRFLNSIRGAYPSGFIVREKISFPLM